MGWGWWVACYWVEDGSVILGLVNGVCGGDGTVLMECMGPKSS